MAIRKKRKEDTTARYEQRKAKSVGKKRAVKAGKAVAASPSRPRYKSPAVAKVRATGAALGRASVRNKTVNKALNRAATAGKARRRGTINEVRAVQAEGAALGRASVRTKPAEMNSARIAAQARKRRGAPARARKATPVTPAERRRKKRKR
jgi:hypothetical protein